MGHCGPNAHFGNVPECSCTKPLRRSSGLCQSCPSSQLKSHSPLCSGELLTPSHRHDPHAEARRNPLPSCIVAEDPEVGDVFERTHGFFSACHPTQSKPQPHTTPTTTTTTTNLQLHSTRHGKTNQVQTQQGLTDGSFFVFSVMVLGRFLSW